MRPHVEGFRHIGEIMAGVWDDITRAYLGRVEVAPEGALRHPVSSDGEGAQQTSEASRKPTCTMQPVYFSKVP